MDIIVRAINEVDTTGNHNKLMNNQKVAAARLKTDMRRILNKFNARKEVTKDEAEDEIKVMPTHFREACRLYMPCWALGRKTRLMAQNGCRM